jgi:hypothetical protein
MLCPEVHMFRWLRHRQTARPMMTLMMAMVMTSACRCGETLQAPAARVAGVVCDVDSGLPLRDASIVIEDSRAATSEATTDADGNFLIEGVAEGSLVVTVTANDASRTFNVDTGANGLAIVEDPACRELAPTPGLGDVRGRICNQHTGDLIRSATITITSSSGSIHTGTTDDTGVFRVFGVPAGEATVVVAGEGYERIFVVVIPDQDVVELIPDSGTCAAPVPGDGLLEGVFCDPAGGPLLGALVEVTDVEGTIHVDRTDENGAFFVGPLDAGAAVVRVTRAPDVDLVLTTTIVVGEVRSLFGGGDCAAETCTSDELPAPPAQVVEVMLVVDRSGSMDFVAPGYPATRWDGVVQALTAVSFNLQDRVDFGLAVFPALDPFGEEDGCQAGEVLLAPQPGSGAAIDAALHRFDVLPGGATPTGSSVGAVAAWFADNPSNKPRAVLLATDGGPNCNGNLNPNSCICTSGAQPCGDARACLDESGTVSQVRALAQAGVPTYVVGVPGVEAFGFVLDAMAEAGGTALTGVNTGERYYLARDVDTLQQAAEDIGRRAVGCDVALTDAQQALLQSASRLDVEVDGMGIAPDATHTNGFDVTGATFTFYGAACDAWVRAGRATLSSCSLTNEVQP